jgi:Pyridoxamine 5'-phosphate oxidase
MPSRRDAITMTDAELHRFLQEEKIVTVATIGPKGRPHLMPLWFVADGSVISAWTFGKSQKVKNLQRLPQATLQVEAGERYEELRGAMLRTDVVIHRDHDTVLGLGMELLLRYGGGVDEAERRRVLGQVAKRVALEFRTRDVVSWDHRKFAVRAPLL